MKSFFKKVSELLVSISGFLGAVLVVMGIVAFLIFSEHAVNAALPQSMVMDVLNEENEKIGIIVVEDSSLLAVSGTVYIYTPECPAVLNYFEDTVAVSCVDGPAQNYKVHADLDGKRMYVKINRLDTMRNSKGG